MRAPRWARALLRFLARRDHEQDVLGDLEEFHAHRVQQYGRVRGSLLTLLDTLDMARALLVSRLTGLGAGRTETETGEVESALRGAGISWLDFKLGYRMLIRYPGLTLVAGLAIAFAITLGAGSFEFLTDLANPKIPLDEGHRLVELRYQDLSSARRSPARLHDFTTWRDELGSLSEVGAFQSFSQNLGVEEGEGAPVVGAALTAEAFQMSRVPPVLGRPLLETDEQPGARRVVLIGHEIWRGRFNQDPDIVGRTVHLGSESFTVIGVMPEGFGYPWAHQVWTALRLNPVDYAWGEGPPVRVMARLAAGVDMRQARSELTALGQRLSADYPETHEHLRPTIDRFGRIPGVLSGVTASAAFMLNALFFAMLVSLVCATVALLLFARTAARQNEIVVRSALGASRGRIVAQLFTEALVLAGVAGLVGIWGAKVGLGWVMDRLHQQAGGVFGFWFGDDLSASTVAYALCFTAFAAVLCGVLPAVKATGRGLRADLQGAGSGGGLEFGRFWTTVIVIQVAVTVGFLPIVIMLGVQLAEIRSSDPGFPASEYLSARVEVDRTLMPLFDPLHVSDAETEDGFHARYQARIATLKERLSNDPRVSVVAVTEHIPGGYHPRRWMEVEDVPVREGSVAGRRVQTGAVGVDLFNAVGAPILDGRGFDAADLDSDHRVVVVNEDFVQHVMNGRSPVGRRLAFSSPTGDDSRSPYDRGPWHEIIGVVRQVGMTLSPELTDAAGVYQLARAAQAYPVHVIMRVGANPAAYTPNLRATGASVDRELQLHDIRPADQGAWQTELAYRSWFWVVLGGGGAGLLLATAGIYSLMAFIVARRTREIGVRVALGANHWRVIRAIFARAFGQVGLGVLVGGGLTLLFAIVLSEGGYRPSLGHGLFLVGYLLAMFGVCSLACVVPTRRALAIEPRDALSAET